MVRKRRCDYPLEEQAAMREKDRLYQQQRRKRIMDSMSEDERKEYFIDLYESRLFNRLQKRLDAL